MHSMIFLDNILPFNVHRQFSGKPLASETPSNTETKTRNKYLNLNTKPVRPTTIGEETETRTIRVYREAIKNFTTKNMKHHDSIWKSTDPRSLNRWKFRLDVYPMASKVSKWSALCSSAASCNSYNIVSPYSPLTVRTVYVVVIVVLVARR